MGMAVALDSLGRVATAEGRGERAALLLGAAEGVWDIVGMSETGNPFAFAPSRSDGLQQARALLGKQRFRDLSAEDPSSASTARSDSPSRWSPTRVHLLRPSSRRR